MTHAVAIRGLRKVFDGRAGAVEALAAIDMTLAEGEFACILGPSGCGKSTLLNVIAGFEAPTEGSATVFGTPVAAPGPERAVVFQEASLFPWLSVWDNVTFGPRMLGRPKAETDALARRFLDLVGLAGFERHLPDQLSGGMKQRVGIARCLILNPRVYLMDEPFGALDAQTRMQMQELLTHVWDEARGTVLFITHDIDEAIFLADTVYVMTARPGRMRSRIVIDLPRPRSIELLTDPRFNALRADILRQIREEATKATAAIEAEERARR
ncbi:ABC transporter ATP-binding protein [Elioraea tepidiphila]|jgi:NitT/TauT family transport system ATP-binding protein|uniref:ABC transporter ATP-binding protein n=1 Tax=Elioraea tepidiphila TaxID=457934 RepID=UPI000371DDA6|nr:ABC transporter ATP-binding protein [Elioraea tepidiphila]